MVVRHSTVDLEDDRYFREEAGDLVGSEPITGFEGDPINAFLQCLPFRVNAGIRTC